MEFQEYKTEIKVTRAKGGQCWTNIVGSLLCQASEELGNGEANRLIRECRLEKDGWKEEQAE